MVMAALVFRLGWEGAVEVKLQTKHRQNDLCNIAAQGGKQATVSALLPTTASSAALHADSCVAALTLMQSPLHCHGWLYSTHSCACATPASHNSYAAASVKPLRRKLSASIKT
jgi:hypothetical protein